MDNQKIETCRTNFKQCLDNSRGNHDICLVEFTDCLTKFLKSTTTVYYPKYDYAKERRRRNRSQIW